jgi:hypothetical protein
MTADNDVQRDWLDGYDDPLVARLRALRLARAPAEVRERCWEQIKARIEEPQAEFEADDLAEGRLREVDRFTFTVRNELRRPTLADRWSRAGSRPLAAAL